MSAKHSKYENYDKESKGKLWKVVKPLLIALAIVFGLCVLSLALEDSGVFPGSILNKISVSSFLKNNTEEEKSGIAVMMRMQVFIFISAP